MVKPKKSVLGLEKYSPPLEGRRGKIRLDFNENLFGCSPKVLDALRSINTDDISVYPEYDKFRAELSKFLSVKPSNLVLTNGTDEAIKAVIDAYLDKDDEVIVPVPTFAMFESYARVAGARIRKVNYNADLSFPAKGIIAEISDKTKMIIIVSPNNPTGSSATLDEIRRIAEKASNSIILVDEAYAQFSRKSAQGMINEFDNVIVTYTFSKAFGLAGLRLGVIITNPLNAENIRKVISPYSVNSMAIVAATAAINDADYLSRCVNEIISSRTYLEQELSSLGLITYPTDANFILAYLGNRCKSAVNELKDLGILVRDRSADPLLNNCIRITVPPLPMARMFVEKLYQVLRPEVLLFDMDGVLVDVSESYDRAIIQSVEYFAGCAVSREEIKKYRKSVNNDWVITQKIVEARGKPILLEEVIPLFQRFYKGSNYDGLITNERWLIDNKYLSVLKRKYKLGIVTGRPKDEALYALKRNNAIDFFDAVVSRDDIAKDKPSPEGILKALGMLNLKYAVYFGDSDTDSNAAKQAGIQFKRVNLDINQQVRRFLQ